MIPLPFWVINHIGFPDCVNFVILDSQMMSIFWEHSLISMLYVYMQPRPTNYRYTSRIHHTIITSHTWSPQSNHTLIQSYNNTTVWTPRINGKHARIQQHSTILTSHNPPPQLPQDFYTTFAQRASTAPPKAYTHMAPSSHHMVREMGPLLWVYNPSKILQIA